MSNFPVSESKINDLKRRMNLLGMREADLEESFHRSSGPGGQKVNKTSTAIRIVHRPTGTSVVSQKARTQGLNRFLARRRLVELLESKTMGNKSPLEKQQLKIRKQKARRKRRGKRGDPSKKQGNY